MKKSFIRAERTFILLLSAGIIIFVLVCIFASFIIHSRNSFVAPEPPEQTQTDQAQTEQAQRMSAPSADDGDNPIGTLSVKITGSSVVLSDDNGDGTSGYSEIRLGSQYRYIDEKVDPLGNKWYKFQYSSDKTGWVNENSATLIITPPRGKESIRDFVAQIGKKYGAVGIQVAVIHHGAVGETYEYGYATKGSVPMGPDHKIRAASVTKVVVGMNAMKMREEGIIDLDADISEYWNSKLARPITMRQLLTHTSHLKYLKSNGSRNGTLSQLRSPASYRASAGWLYNNYAIGIAGATLEVAANRTLNSYANEKFFAPLNIDTAFNSGEIREKRLIATLYNPNDSVSRTAAASAGFSKKGVGSNAPFFAGGLTISAKDLAKLTAILANDGTYEGVRYLSEESVQLMETSSCLAESRGHDFEQCIPLRYQTDIYGQSRMYYHLGIAYGTLSILSYNPDTRDGVVVISTGASQVHDDRGIFRICGEIVDYIYNS